MKKRKSHRQMLEMGSVASEVSRDLLFMLVSWWCKSEKLWDVLLKYTYVCRERLSLHSGGLSQGSMCSQLSAQYSCLAEGGDVGAEWLFLSLSGLALETRTSNEGREEEGGARQGRMSPVWDRQALTPLPIVFSFDFVVCQREYFIALRDLQCYGICTRCMI